MTAQHDTTPEATPTDGSRRPAADLYDRIRMLHLVEDALRDAPWCSCGSQLTVEVEDDTMWLECPSFMEPTSGRLGWLRDGIRGALHEKQVIARDIALAA